MTADRRDVCDGTFTPVNLALGKHAKPGKYGRYVSSSEGRGARGEGVTQQSEWQLVGRELFVVTPISLCLEMDQFSQIPGRLWWLRSKLPSFPTAG